MSDRRSARLNEQLKREISDILMRKVRDPRVGPVLITDVRVTRDLWLARVFFRPREGGLDPSESLAGLEAAAPFIRTELARVLHLRRIPELRFLHDTTLDSAMRIEQVLREVLPPEEDVEARDAASAPEPEDEGPGEEE